MMHTPPTADSEDRPYILKRGSFAGFTRMQAFLTGVLPFCVLTGALLAAMSMYRGWHATGPSGMLLGLVGSIGVGAFAAGGLGLVIWAIENSKRMALLYVISVGGASVVYLSGGISALVLMVYVAGVVLSWLFERMRQ